MATRGAIAGLDAAAQQRLDAAVTALAERFSVAMLPPAPYARDPALQAVYERERLACLLEMVVSASAIEVVVTSTSGTSHRPKKESAHA
jgi:hypothetical protein